MKQIIALGFLVFTGVAWGAMGGPDAYGYIWKDSVEPDGPVFNWIDITTVGTEITGFADDNSAAMIPMGMNFQYYWVTYNQVKPGSNGWVSFNDVGNVAHCFPSLPTPGSTGDNLVAPMMSDLNFVGPGNPGKAYYYHDALNGQFIISYVDVPFWFNNANGYIGLNTFQVIFDEEDFSITFQYLDVDQANFTDNGFCATDSSIGIENVTGNIGLQILADVVPADNLAIRIEYPKVPLIDVTDPKPDWVYNANNAAEFIWANEPFTVSAQISNAGSADTTQPVDIDLVIFDAAQNQVDSDTTQVSGLMSQETADVDFVSEFVLDVGAHSINVATVSAEDLNVNNNQIQTELQVLNQTSPMLLGYTDVFAPNGSISWNGGNGGAGVFMQPPTVGWWITTIEAFMATSTGNANGYTLHIYANDGGNDLPGTLLTSEVVADDSYTFNSWVRTDLSTPIQVPASGFFVVWEQINATNAVLGTDSPLGAVSRRNVELLGGAFSPYRENENRDVMLRVEVVDLIFANGFQ